MIIPLFTLLLRLRVWLSSWTVHCYHILITSPGPLISIYIILTAFTPPLPPYTTAILVYSLDISLIDYCNNLVLLINHFISFNCFKTQQPVLSPESPPFTTSPLFCSSFTGFRLSFQLTLRFSCSLLRPSIILPLHICLTSSTSIFPPVLSDLPLLFTLLSLLLVSSPWGAGHSVALLPGSRIHYHQTLEILTLYLFLFIYFI